MCMTSLSYGPFISRAQAKEQGLKQYFTGKPCKHGHVESRYVNGSLCLECNRLNAQAIRDERSSELNEKRRERRVEPSFAGKRAADCKRKRETFANHSQSDRELHRKRSRTAKRKYDKTIKAKETTKAWKSSSSTYRVMHNVRTRLRELVLNKSARTSTLTGCTGSELVEHLTRQFENGMSWENYGFYGWHIDHIRPCASFDLTDPEQQRECFHFSNLQPLWAEDNLRKSDHWNPEA